MHDARPRSVAVTLVLTPGEQRGDVLRGRVEESGVRRVSGRPVRSTTRR